MEAFFFCSGSIKTKRARGLLAVDEAQHVVVEVILAGPARHELKRLAELQRVLLAHQLEKGKQTRKQIYKQSKEQAEGWWLQKAELNYNHLQLSRNQNDQSVLLN